ncbi:hypothetical protein BGZ51_005188 [Haplosporangium sp. Z 767]|nr:hypothetical protein BGZ51_005188 [Haplosporangium sp. Z 767]
MLISKSARYLSTVPTRKHLDNLHDLVDKARIQCGIAGMSVGIFHKGELIFANGFGKRNNKDEPFTAKTLAPIGSLTKAFTATAIGELVAEGKMDWDSTPVSKYLPEFELKDPVLTSQLTLTDLLSHRTGLPNLDFAWHKVPFSRRELIKRLRHVDGMPLKLGSKTQYNNIMYAVAGEAAANVAGISYEALVHEKLLTPLGLTNTGFSPMEMVKKQTDYSMPFGTATLKDAQNGVFEMKPLEDACSTVSPAGDMYSNVLDLVRWGKTILDQGMVDGQQVLNKDCLVETLTPHTISAAPRRGPEFAPAETYGFGWVIDSYKGHVLFTHNGAISGFGSDLTIFPDDDLVIAQLFNMFPACISLDTNLIYHIADTILDLPRTQDWLGDVAVKNTKELHSQIAQLIKDSLPGRIPNRPPLHPLQDYVGTYSHPVFGDISVRLETEPKTGDQTLVYRMGLVESKLEHYHFEAFVSKADILMATLERLGVFQTGADGKVKSLTEYGSQAEFKRKEDNSGPPA